MPKEKPKNEQEEKLTAEMLQRGQEFKQDNLALQIIELHPNFNTSRGRCYLVGFRLRDGDRVSEIGHFELSFGKDPRPKITQLLEDYKKDRVFLKTLLKPM